MVTLIAAVTASAVLADAVSLGALPTILMSVLSSGLIVALLTAPWKNRETSTNRQKTLDSMQAEVLLDAQKRYAAMSSEVDGLRTKLAEHGTREAAMSARLAERDLKIEILQREVERLHDQVTAMRAQLGLAGRRKLDGPGPVD